MSTNCAHECTNKHLCMCVCVSHTCRARGGRCPSPLPLSGFSCKFPDIRLIHTHQDIFRLDVGVDDLTLGVQVVQTLQYLGNKQTQTD